MRIQWICLVGVLATLAPEMHAQAANNTPSATITFYAGGTLANSLLPVSKNAVFSGCIFDGEQMLGCITHQTFVTVKIAPGPHIFSASLSEHHAAKNSQTELTLEPGKNYFMRTLTQNNTFKDVVGRSRGRLEVVSCEVAHSETTRSKVMGQDQLGESYQNNGLPDMPACP